MRYGIISDIHANLEALKLALAHLDTQSIDHILCLGDVVGYNANPHECVEIVRKRALCTIQGNHERMVLGASLMGVRKETVEATEWTRRQLGEDDLKWLGSLPEDMLCPVDDKILLVHGSVRDKDEYVLSPDVIRENINELKRRHPQVKVCFFGHSHYPMVIGAPEVHTRFHETRTITLHPDRLYLINPGSVGQPRDGCPLAAWAIYDNERLTVTIYRQPYDVPATQKKMIDAGLDKRLAQRLEVGK
jgi:predicted phosphodiesterase